ncbi:hypothetical protein M2451_001066 [Dysgonomonas sp. PFB1-18]|uniref:hypothetical protein n=1 Tax=unclassified Dysgonomonas TaxID=2630389 RepID=UPI0024766C5C|nr:MULTISPECIES: hypothetical protein [unclassified Dysgonomonas]MDH6308310.1 hypothetical protein [Dysgonomonas sp. PF1-14]MDH6338252.1 hypothetical protein [Dysgonomonas sp. PF1-16]MDH6379749.1 hypothetical protein [Dysgonomonas sp. PFB1-18]MDH6397161.1 hypothetical protein [Dysgonomonas sp. PF1-23]
MLEKAPDMIGLFIGLFLIVIISLCVLVVIIAIFWAVVKWGDKKNRSIGCLTVILFFILTIICCGYFGNRIMNSVSDLIWGFPDSPYMDSLKSVQPIDRQIPKEFFTKAGIYDYYRMPLVYPYSMNAINDLDYGYIDNEEGKIYRAEDTNKNRQVMDSIASFSFNKEILIAQRKTTVSNFRLLHFKTGEIEEFDNDSTMKIKAYQYGLDTIRPMITVDEYYTKFLKKQ